MENFNYDSYCGLYCGACEIMNLYRSCREQGKPAKWEDLSAPLRDNIPRAEVKCHGCKTDTVFAGCQGCKIRECARSKKVEACPGCPEFPCEMVKALKETVPTFRDKLPHTVAIFGDLEIAKKKGLGTWLEHQRNRWRCPSCGAAFTWYQDKCQKCGLDLKKARGY